MYKTFRFGEETSFRHVILILHFEYIKYPREEKQTFRLMVKLFGK